MSVLPFIALSLFSYPFLYSRVPNNCCGGGGLENSRKFNETYTIGLTITTKLGMLPLLNVMDFFLVHIWRKL